MSEEELIEVVAVLPVENKPNGSVVDDDDDDDDCVILDVKVNKPNRVVVDDDCVVLNGDPENQVNSLNDSPIGSDELLVVGEKGQIACRDYPHSRHLCVKFPYSSTPHERHCVQCHCYVCDSPAPCLKWGNGLSTTDHCHATDKSETWKTLREDSKLVKTAPLSASTNNGPIGNVVNSQHNHTFPLDTSLSSISVLMNRSSKSTALRALSARRSRSTALRPRSFNLSLQSQAYQQISMNALSSRRSRIQNQIFNGSDGFGVQNPAIKKKRGRRVSGARSTATTNYATPPGAPGFRNLVNPQYGDGYPAAAATGFSKSSNGYGQDGDFFSIALNSLLTQPNHSPAPAYETQPRYRSNNNIWVNKSLSSNVARLNGNQHLKEHQIGSQNENIINSGAAMPNVFQQKPHGGDSK